MGISLKINFQTLEFVSFAARAVRRIFLKKNRRQIPPKKGIGIKMDSKESFKYNYSAPTEAERREIESIRRSYTAADREGGKLERLRALDKRVKSVSLALALTFGIVGILVFGLGLSMVLEWNLIFGGVSVSVFGALFMCFAHPLHKLLLKRGRKKHGAEIIKLSEELLNGEGK